MLLLTFSAPLCQIVIDLSSHFLATGSCDESQLSKGCIVQYSLIVFVNGFHQIHVLSFEVRVCAWL